MANDRNDFEPSVRNSAWWSGDSRKAANGHANEAVMTKMGLMPPVDLSDVEAVQMGHVMQPVIGRLASEKLRLELKDADYVMTHPKETWLKSHFDFISADGKTLVEAKNYDKMTRNKFDETANIIPAADMAQLIHESACHGIDRVVLAVLFGGNEFQTFDFTITQDQRDLLIKDMAVFWGHVQSGVPLPPETVAQARLMYATDSGTSVTANQQIETAAAQLKGIKQQIKQLEEHEANLTMALQGYMRDHSEIIRVDGTVVATWKTAKSSMKFNATLFQQAMPDIYKQFVTEVPGSRRFLVK